MRKKRNNKDNNSVQDNVIECKYTDKKGFKITLDMLENLLEKALDSNKKPLLIVAIRRNDEEVFVLKSSISIERK